MRPELPKVKVMGHGLWAVGHGRRQGFAYGAALQMWARTLEPLMTDRGCNWPGGNNMPGSTSPSRSFFAGRDRDTALATARLIASSHSNIIAAFHDRSDHNHNHSQSSRSFSLSPPPPESII